MQIRTTLKDFPHKIKTYQLAPDTPILVIIADSDSKVQGLDTPLTHNEQKRLLNLLMPTEYDPDASNELVRIISESHLNTDTISL